MKWKGSHLSLLVSRRADRGSAPCTAHHYALCYFHHHKKKNTHHLLNLSKKNPLKCSSIQCEDAEKYSPIRVEQWIMYNDDVRCEKEIWATHFPPARQELFFDMLCITWSLGLLYYSDYSITRGMTSPRKSRFMLLTSRSIFHDGVRMKRERFPSVALKGLWSWEASQDSFHCWSATEISI